MTRLTRLSQGLSPTHRFNRVYKDHTGIGIAVAREPEQSEPGKAQTYRLPTVELTVGYTLPGVCSQYCVASLREAELKELITALQAAHDSLRDEG